MNTLHKQRGLGLFGFIFLFALIGFVALVLVKTVPLYMNQMTLKRDLHEVANTINANGADEDISEIRRDVEKRFDIDYISQIEAKDIMVRRTSKGVMMSYDYEARANLFSNIFIVIHFAEDIPLRINVPG